MLLGLVVGRIRLRPAGSGLASGGQGYATAARCPLVLVGWWCPLDGRGFPACRLANKLCRSFRLWSW